MNLFSKDLYRPQVGGVIHHFYISGPIETAEDYIDLLDCLYTCSPTDVVMLHLNTPGGCLDTTTQIVHAMAECQGQVITCADGMVASAGSILFFAGHGWKIGEFSQFLLHDGSTGSFGKVNDNLAAAKADSDRIHRLYHAIYGKFFTEEEIDNILAGRDAHLSAEQVEGRVEKFVKEEEEKE